ncbi:MAG: alpha/beta fold hydrolase [Burkholderiales bacterium]|nr:alpha/beta fold hydrolase [Burkholderiales bacterium]
MRILKHLALFAAYGLAGAVLALVIAYVAYLQSRPDLKPWHTVRLAAEFRAADRDRVRTLAEYQAIEERVFADLRGTVYPRTAPADRRRLNRYFAGSLADPAGYRRDWNRTLELAAPNPRGAVLLLHGLSDSPYSMRPLAERLHAEGYRTLALRLPGHGTAPSGLVHAQWQDWAAAARLGARHLRGRIGADLPLYVVGYSTGGALAVEYALARRAGEDLPRVDGLILVSAAIGVSPVAALAAWQARLAALPGFEKLAWSSIGPEFDPFKYVSFAVNAGVQIHALTTEIDARIAALDKGGGVEGMPRVLAFQSAADATVDAGALVRVLLGRLAPAGHELVAFDVNRHAEAAPLLAPGTGEDVRRLLVAGPLPFALSVITNRDPHSAETVAQYRPAGTATTGADPVGIAWPPGVFSLSHVSLPFPPSDPLYGAARPAVIEGVYLGRPELLGERGLLAVPESELVRLRFNPFFSYLERRVLEFVRLR